MPSFTCTVPAAIGYYGATPQSGIQCIFSGCIFNNGKVYQLHAQQVAQGDLYGFVSIADLLFDEHTSIVIDPAEEKLKAEFAGVQRLMLPMHAIIRIEEVESRGAKTRFSILMARSPTSRRFRCRRPTVAADARQRHAA